MRTLCIDIGGTRIKWAVIDEAAIRSISDLIAIRVKSTLSRDWLSARLPSLLDARDPASITCACGRFDRIAISLCGAVHPRTGLLDDDLVSLGVPADLLARFEQHTALKIVVVNDALAWMRGAVRYARLANVTLRDPVIALILGTGAGLARTDERGAAGDIEFDERFAPNHLSRVVKLPANFQYWSIHEVIGAMVLEGFAREQRTHEKICEEFTARVAAVLMDIAQVYGAPATVILGGGNARFVSAEGLSVALGNLAVLSLSESVLGKICPDAIPLLGCLEAN